MALKGNVNDLKKLGQRLNKFPITMAHNVAQKSAPQLTAFTRSAYNSGRTVYGDSRPDGANGRPLTLRKTGATEDTLRFTAVGTIVRCVLGTPYARYLIGNYRVLPMGAMPVTWGKAIADFVSQEKF